MRPIQLSGGDMHLMVTGKASRPSSANNNQFNRPAVNLSLFDPGSSLENSFFNITNNLNANNNNSSGGGANVNNSNLNNKSRSVDSDRIYNEYGTGLYDSNSTTTTATEKLSQYSLNSAEMSLDRRIARKKWASILTEDDETTSTSHSESDTRYLHCHNLSNSSVSQGPLASDDSLFDTASSASFGLQKSAAGKKAVRKVAAASPRIMTCSGVIDRVAMVRSETRGFSPAAGVADSDAMARATASAGSSAASIWPRITMAAA
jgi:hypothetical protein